jgi:hypothetical protein
MSRRRRDAHPGLRIAGAAHAVVRATVRVRIARFGGACSGGAREVHRLRRGTLRVGRARLGHAVTCGRAALVGAAVACRLACGDATARLASHRAHATARRSAHHLRRRRSVVDERAVRVDAARVLRHGADAAADGHATGAALEGRGAVGVGVASGRGVGGGARVGGAAVAGSDRGRRRAAPGSDGGEQTQGCGKTKRCHGLYRASVAALEPHVHLAGRVPGLDVHDARTTADRAVFGVRLPRATARIDVELLGLAAEGAGDLRRRAGAPAFALRRRHGGHDSRGSRPALVYRQGVDHAWAA